MLDPRNLFERMFSGNVVGGIGQAGKMATDRLNRASGAQGFAGGAVAGGRVDRDVKTGLEIRVHQSDRAGGVDVHKAAFGDVKRT